MVSLLLLSARRRSTREPALKNPDAARCPLKEEQPEIGQIRDFPSKAEWH